MKDASLYEKAGMYDNGFPIQLLKVEKNCQMMAFTSHWHEQLEILYFTEGNAVIQCNSISYEASPGDLIIINSNELHTGYNVGNYLAYYCFNIDSSFIHSRFMDTCEMKYITPIERNMILFKNKVSGDNSIIECINAVIREYESKETAYELVIKSCAYKLLAMLIRNHVTKVITHAEYAKSLCYLERLAKVFKYIEENYNQKITIEDLSSMSNLSSYYFCRMFKMVTGKTMIEYINSFRINKADYLLKSTDMNVTEVAMATGFNDINYFSRTFKKYKKISPSHVTKVN
ncbi:MAG TPA: AraC family transcriptional regulator [Clostridiales bacterium]|nr:AraC family transcriptional regulator [Clostridiales bacterium]